MLLFLPAVVLAGPAGRWQCISGIVIDTARRAEIVASVQHYNQAPPDPHQLDAEWPTLVSTDEPLRKVLRNPAAKLMRHVIQSVSQQGEAFLMGANGGLVASTDKSTDFWQGDEDQFTQAIGLASGQVHVDDQVSDESTHSIQVRLSTPVYDPATQKAIGVLMLGFDAFVLDYLRTCDK